MYDDPRISYSQLVTAAQKAESEQEVKGIEGARVKTTLVEKDEIILGVLRTKCTTKGDHSVTP